MLRQEKSRSSSFCTDSWLHNIFSILALEICARILFLCGNILPAVWLNNSMWCGMIKNWVLTVSMGNKKKKKSLKDLQSSITKCDLWDLGAHVTVADSSDCLVRVY